MTSKRAHQHKPTPRKEMPWGSLPSPVPGTPSFSGLVCIDKDSGVTSHDVVAAVRRLAGTRKVGHAGTLDPMATGVLCVGVGRATKLLQYVTGESKEYTATIRFGVKTTTDDADGDIVETAGCAELLVSDIETHMRSLTGNIMQVPSSVSAIKVHGKRAYELARAGSEVTLQARPITVSQFDLCGDLRAGECAGVSVVDVDVHVHCSAGTYIRALARDLGERLGVGAHLIALRRTRVGIWSENNCLSIADLAKHVRDGRVLPHVTLADVCSSLFCVLQVSKEEAARLQHGQFIDRREVQGTAVAFCDSVPIALVEEHKRQFKPSLLLTLAHSDEENR